MPTLSDTVAVFVAARELDRATLSRLGFWVDQFGAPDSTAIVRADVNAA